MRINGKKGCKEKVIGSVISLSAKKPLSTEQLLKERSERYSALENKIQKLSLTKLGYPTSLQGANFFFTNHSILGLKENSLITFFLNNVGNPYMEAAYYSMEVKDFEVEIIETIGRHLGIPPNLSRGYITTGGTEGNFACIRWLILMIQKKQKPKLDRFIHYNQQLKAKIKEYEKDIKSINVKSVSDKDKISEKIEYCEKQLLQSIVVIQQLSFPSLFCTKFFTHYSILKIANDLKLNIVLIKGDKLGAMDLQDFKLNLDKHIKQNPDNAIIINANIGTTITGAIDDVPTIKKILQQYGDKIIYQIHGDAALFGLLLPVLNPFNNQKNYLELFDTLAMSFHKYLGIPLASGLALTTKSTLDYVYLEGENIISYAGDIHDITVSGSRSGMMIMLVHNTIIYGLNLRETTLILKKIIYKDLENAEYCCSQLMKIFGNKNVIYVPKQFNVVMPKPSDAFAAKYQLMVEDDKAVICVLGNVTKKTIDVFLNDLIIDHKLNKEQTMSQPVITFNKVLANETSTTKVPFNHPDFPYEIKVLNQTHIKEAAEVFVRAFCDREPLTLHLKISHDDFRPFALEVTKKAAQDGLSVVAVCKKTGKVVGCAIGEDMADPLQAGQYPKLDPVFLLLDQASKPPQPINEKNYIDVEMNSKSTAERKYQRREAFHIWVTALLPEALGRGLSTIMNNESVYIAVVEEGFKEVHAEFTSDINEKWMNCFKNKKLINSIPFKNFILPGTTQKPFEGVTGVATSYIWKTHYKELKKYLPYKFHPKYEKEIYSMGWANTEEEVNKHIYPNTDITPAKEVKLRAKL